MKYRQYAEYKDSGVEWLGKVPAHWEITEIRHLAEAGYRTFIDGDWIELPYITDEGVRLIQTGNIGIGQYKEQGFRFISEESFRELGCTEVLPNDVLICRLADPVGRACLAPGAPYKQITAVDVCILRTKADVDERFVVYFLSSNVYLDFIASVSRGGTRERISRSFLGIVQFPLPYKFEQAAIADFLDYETAQIDALIAKQERLIAVLQEKGQALISHAVTKGLNPDAPMKDSGVEWLGEVPAHWEVKQLKYELEFVTSGSRGWAENYADEGDIFLRIGNLTRDSIVLDLSDIQHVIAPAGPEAERTRVRSGDLLVSITADLGSVAVVPVAFPVAYINQHIALGRPFGVCAYPEWLGYQVLSTVGKTQLALQAYGGTKIQLSLEDIKTLRILVPPLDEQQAILDFTEVQERRSQELKIAAETAINRLKERRSSLISAAVTGKIDVLDRATLPVNS